MKEQLANYPAAAVPLSAPTGSARIPLPTYLIETYWWAYVHPRAVHLFERQWLVNLILWGNYRRLQDVALMEIDPQVHRKVLQVACVYGDLTQRLSNRLDAGGTVDVVDVAPVQLANLRKKLGASLRVATRQEDSRALSCASGAYDCVLVFFLLHEQPEEVRIRTIREALRAVKPGGKLVFVDYHNPRRVNPLRYLMVPILKGLEPYAMDLWKREIADYFPSDGAVNSVRKETYFGELYQKVVVTR